MKTLSGGPPAVSTYEGTRGVVFVSFVVLLPNLVGRKAGAAPA